MATSRKLWSDKLSAVGKSGAAVSSRNIFAEKSLKKARTRILQDSLGAFAPPVQFEGVILGVDPSLRGTGLAVLKIAKGSRPLYLNSMTVKNSPDLSVAECIKNIFLRVDEFVRRYKVGVVSIEQSIYVQNNRVALVLGSARGAAIAAAAVAGAEIFEYAPLRIKQAVVGFGRASKEQVSRTMSSLVDGAPKPFPFDEADAAAAALAHAFTKGRRGIPV